MSEDLKGKTYSFDVCSQCRLICCQDANPPLTPKRVRILEIYLRKKKIISDNTITIEEYTHPAANASGVCVFLDKNTRRCLVHRVKPETCKAGPITFDINLKTAKVEWFLKKGNICLLAERLFKNKEALMLHLEAAKGEIIQLICELDAKDLRAILKIPEPHTFKIGEDELPMKVQEKLGIS